MVWEAVTTVGGGALIKGAGLKLPSVIASGEKLKSNLQQRVQAFRSAPESEYRQLQHEVEQAVNNYNRIAHKNGNKPNATLTLKKKAGNGEFAFNQKVSKLQEAAKKGELVKTTPEVRDKRLIEKYRKQINNKIAQQYGRSNPEFAAQLKDKINKMDVDHIVDLQLNGKDILSNLRMLDRSTNRSIGPQITHQIKNLPEGTKIDQVIIKDKR
jgi:hypothetical protein